MLRASSVTPTNESSIGFWTSTTPTKSHTGWCRTTSRPDAGRSESRPVGSPRQCSSRKSTCRAFDFEANPNIDPVVVHTLAKGEWVHKGQPLCLIGDSGTGKSHLLIALGTEAAMAGYRVKYTLATQLANELVEAADELPLAKTIARYGRVDLLCIDELGYMQLDRRGAELLSRSSPSVRRRSRSRSRPMSPSADGPRRSPTPGCARPSSTGLPSVAPSWRPAPTLIAWPRPPRSRRADRRSYARAVVSTQTYITGVDLARVVSGLTGKWCRTKPAKPNG
ncbi:IstB-like ATP binding protein [Brevibacterium aurantiacum]|uniref:IstB-like ATP binding protein n=1 Tax=Brevibacterium aurantiacum TaxID=273384 RepID=A0A2H1KY33_BREAU|nr:IstB-like ATP binding protein [Brevibacterium aurantiacum]